MSEIVAPLDFDKLKDALDKFHRFKKELLSENDWIKIGDKIFLKKSAWRKWALACSVSDKLLSQERVPATGKDDLGEFYYRIVVEAFHLSTGRSATGTAIASCKEKKSWTHEEHDVYTLAHTRAKNRAIADLVGGGEVSAEEVEAEQHKQIDPPLSERATWHIKGDSLEEAIFHKTIVVGTVRVDRQNGVYQFKSESELRADAAPIANFLGKKILPAIKEKHPDVDYLIEAADGKLQAIWVRGIQDESRLKELMDAVGWAFAKAAESQQAGGAQK